MKTTKELESLKEEMAQLKSKLVELTDEELAMVTGGLKIADIFHNYTEDEVKPFYNYTQIVR